MGFLFGERKKMVPLQSLLLGSAMGTYQGPNYRVPYYRNKYGSDEITHVVEFEVSRSGYQGVGAKDALNSEPTVLGKVKIGLYGYVVPGTVRNFCTFADLATQGSSYVVCGIKISSRHQRLHDPGRRCRPRRWARLD